MNDNIPGHFFIDTKEVFESEDGKIVYVYDYKYEKEKKKSNLKKSNREFFDYLCVIKGCKACIRKYVQNGRFYHNTRKGASTSSIHNHKRPNQKYIPTSSPRDIVSQPPSNQNNENYSRKRVQIYVKEEKKNEESSINGVLDSEGPLCGDNDVDIYFSLSVSDGMHRFLESNGIVFIRFGTKRALQFGKPNRVRDTVRIFSIQFQGHDLRDKCMRSQFVVQVIVPQGDSIGPVDVSLGFKNEIEITKKNGYNYYRRGDMVSQGQPIPSNFLGEYDYNFDFPNFDNEEEEEENGDLMNGGGVDPMFNSPGYYNLIAQNRFEEVKKLLKNGIIKVGQRDLMGFSALDVAKHFKRTEIEKLLIEYKEKIMNEEVQEMEKKEEIEEEEEEEDDDDDDDEEKEEEEIVKKNSICIRN